MPIYVYKHTGSASKRFSVPCKRGETFEIKQSMKDEPLRYCPDCGSALQKVICPVEFKNTYWYKKHDILDDAERVM